MIRSGEIKMSLSTDDTLIRHSEENLLQLREFIKIAGYKKNQPIKLTEFLHTSNEDSVKVKRIKMRIPCCIWQKFKCTIKVKKKKYKTL